MGVFVHQHESKVDGSPAAGDVQCVIGCMVHIRSVSIMVDKGWLLVMNGYNGWRAW